MDDFEKYFKPTFLYIKRHSVTGMCYFGKTTSDPLKYMGSGTKWNNHINFHGREHVETIWYCLFYDVDTVREFALMCSDMWNIVESKDWVNFFLAFDSSLNFLPNLAKL